MVLKRLLGAIPESTFLEQHFLRLPFSLPGGAAEFTSLGSWETIEAILSQPEADVLVVRQGRRWEEGARRPSFDEARRLHGEGYTLLVRHAERHVPEIAALARSFQSRFLAAVDVHLYCTPAEEHGFGWHYDAEDVFILQTLGEKEYSLRKNTVNPWPLEETLPADMRYEREVMPLMKCTLAAGDWLYIPNGYWHVARALKPSISLAVGVMMPAAIHLLDFARGRLRDSLFWRQRLPVISDSGSEDSRQHYREIVAALAEKLAAEMRDPALLTAYLASRGAMQQD